MFTGIVEEQGVVRSVLERDGSTRLGVAASVVTAGLLPGDSVAVNGVCLTAVGVSADGFDADVIAETLRRSALGALRPGMAVNLERAVTPQTRLGGHLVQGHVDGTGTVLDHSDGVLRVTLPAELTRYVVLKGSITVHGVSLTVSAVDAGSFSVSLIPTTLAATTLGAAEPGDRLNLEVDVIAKYVEKLLLAGAR